MSIPVDSTYFFHIFYSAELTNDTDDLTCSRLQRAFFVSGKRNIYHNIVHTL